MIAPKKVIVSIDDTTHRRNRFALPQPRSFCRRAFCLLGTLGLIPLAVGTIAFFGEFEELSHSKAGCYAFAGGVGLSVFFETILIMTLLNERKKENLETNV